jgi:hypothetical protein
MTHIQTRHLPSLSALRFAALATTVALAGCVERAKEVDPSYETLTVEDRITHAAEVVASHPNLVIKAAPALRQLRGLLEEQSLNEFASTYMKSFNSLRGLLQPVNSNVFSVPNLNSFSSLGFGEFRAWLVTQPDKNFGKIVVALGEVDDACRLVFADKVTLAEFNRTVLGLECFVRQNFINE